MNKKLKLLNIVLIFVILLIINGINKGQKTEYPLIGAQVFIEPGQTEKQIEGWFKTLSELNMPLCRIRMFQTHMQKDDGTWDFSLYDKAFEAAANNNIKIFATLFPSGSDNIGGFKFPTDKKHEEHISKYIAEVVNHFKDHPALYDWVLINEIGWMSLPIDEPYTENKFEEWKKQNQELNTNNEFGRIYFPEDRFFRAHNTNYLNWLANQVHLYDKKTFLHVNTHNVYYQLPQYDFQAWKTVLSSHGASVHPAWLFGRDFKREQYLHAVAITNDIVRRGGEGMPYWVTELQGGNNTYSGAYPLCPTKEEIAQWLWNSVASGAEGIIFWTLNPRQFGNEAGEWAMVDFQNEPSDRLTMAGAVAKSIFDNKELFAKRKPITANIHLVYTQESSYVENKYANTNTRIPGRKKGAGMKSVMTYYNALIEAGINANIFNLNDFSSNKTDYSNEVMIIAHQVAISKKQWDIITNFVEKGGKLIMTGLSGFYNEYSQSVFMSKDYPIKIFGAEMTEVKLIDDIFPVMLNEKGPELPCHFWQGYLKLNDAEKIAEKNGIPVGVKNSYGKGEAIWLPSLVGLGADISGSSQLSKWLQSECVAAVNQTPFYFDKQYKNILLKVLDCDSHYITTISNTDKNAMEINLKVNCKTKEPRIVFSTNNQSNFDNNSIHLEGNDIIVLSWAKIK